MNFFQKRSFRQELEDAYPRLWRFSVSVTGSYEAGQELAQATVLRALEKAKLYQRGTRIDLWLFKMAHRTWLNDLRAQRTRSGNGQVTVEDANLTDLNPDQVSNIFYGEVLNKVMALPEGQRVVVLLVYVEGYKYAEAAELLEIPIGTIMSRLAAARKTLAEELAEAKDGTL